MPNGATHNAEVRYVTIDTCSDRWIFDSHSRMHCRVPSGPRWDVPLAIAEWHPYYELHLTPLSGVFVVVFHESGAPMVRARRHSEIPCPECGARVDAERSLVHV